MLPWNYGFHWTTGTLIFMGAFYAVLAVVIATVVAALLRARRTMEHGGLEDARWHSDFNELPAADRVCRHVLSGEFRHRECPNGFDCRHCATHGRLLKNCPAAVLSADGGEILGMHFPLDRYYHRGHTWVRPEADGTVTVGIDDLGRRLFVAPDAVELPRPGDRLHVNGTAMRLRKRGADVRVLSPVDGEVVETGGPSSEWYLKVKPVGGAFNFRHLLRGAEIRPWLTREMERLHMALSAEGATAASLADGGVPVADIAANYPEADWDAVCGEMFLRP